MKSEKGLCKIENVWMEKIEAPGETLVAINDNASAHIVVMN
jgi:hypothetical protein